MSHTPQHTSWWQQFGQDYGPGLLNFGTQYLGERQAGREQRGMLRDVRGPLYDQQTDLARQALTQAGSMDPRAMAAERFAAQQQLLAPGEEAQRQALMRQLQSQGLLGLSSHAAVPGVVTTPGQAVNPYLASLLAAQQTQRARSAFESLGEGEQQINRLIDRSSRLQAPGAQATQAALQAKLIAPKPSLTSLLLKTGSGILQDKQTQRGIWDLLKKGGGMLSGLFGDNRSYFGDTDSNFYA